MRVVADNSFGNWGAFPVLLQRRPTTLFDLCPRHHWQQVEAGRNCTQNLVSADVTFRTIPTWFYVWLLQGRQPEMET